MKKFLLALSISSLLFSCKPAEQVLGINKRNYYTPQHLSSPALASAKINKINYPTKKITKITEKDLKHKIFFSKNENTKRVDKLLKAAESYLGTPYRFGGTSRRGIDCSSFTQKVYKNLDITLPRTSIYQAKLGKKIKLKNVSAGDLLFFATGGRGRVSHVAIVYEIKNGTVYFIHAASSKGVSIAPLTNKYWNRRFLMARRLKNFS